MSSSFSETPPVGTLLHAEVGVQRMPLAAMAELDPEQAAARALKAYLEAAVFCIAGRTPARFRLNSVKTEWPEDFTKLEYPAAAITTATVANDPHSLVPTCLEETAGQFGRGTVLWKTAELAVRFVVNFWCTNKPERTAIAAALQEMFAPAEDRYGIVVQGPRGYFDQTVRFTLAEHERVDSSLSVEQRERQLRVTILADIAVVQLRRVVELQPSVRLDDP
jgi:hypothetical protein